MPRDRHLTPAAIVLAGGLIGLGLFYGLRTRPAGETPRPAAIASSSSPTSAAPTTTPPPGPSETAALRARVVLDVTKELDRHRKDVVAACVTPSLAKQPQPPTVRFLFNFVFDESGKQLGRGVNEDRATSRPEVTKCLLEKLQPLTVPPPGERIAVEVQWILP